METWFQKARGLAQEAAKRSQELAKEATKISQEIAEKSKDFAVEATKRADQIKSEASKTADHFKSLAGEITKRSDASASSSSRDAPRPDTDAQLQLYGVTEQLGDFVKGLTSNTFTDFPLDESASQGVQEQETSTPSNICKDLTAWQEQHALLVLKTVPEISRLRYTLCPRHMKERKFWKIYFILVKSHVAPYEARALQQQRASEAEQNKSIRLQDNAGNASAEVELAESSNSSKAKKASTAENDLDAFLLGDLDGSDIEDGDDGYDEDIDKLVNSADLESSDDEGTESVRHLKKSETGQKSTRADDI